MDISRALSISVDYKDRSTPPAWDLRILAGIVLIDKTNDALHPVVYQLKDTLLPLDGDPLQWNAALHHLPSEAFISLGKAVEIDKKNKKIVLDTKSTVSYNYLIVVSGSKPIHTHDEEKFSPGVQTLVEALRIKKKMPLSLGAHLAAKRHLLFKQPSSKSFQSPRLSFMYNTSKPVPPHLAPMTAKRLGINLNTLNKRLYEVFL